LTDDQSQPRIAEEAEAVERILRRLRANTIEWLSSAALEAETSNSPDPERRDAVQVLLLLATKTIPLDGQIIGGQRNSKPLATTPSTHCT
jgi:hypothetical protein